jgi:protein TonB
MTAYIHTNNNTRIAVFIGICLVHVIFGWALITGLAQKAAMKIMEPLITDIVDEDVKDEKPPPPPPPEMERPPVEVPPPEVAIDMPVDVAETTAIQNVTDKPQPPAPPPPPAAKPTPPKTRSFPSAEEYYPPSSVRNEEQGSSVIEICVDAKGKLLRDAAVRTSSGFPKLDEAAVKMARAGRYTPGTMNGQPVPESCVPLKVTFKLKG